MPTSFGMTGIPGANSSGVDVSSPPPTGGANTMTMGSNPSPFASTPPTGQGTPGLSSPIAQAGPGPNAFDPATLLGFGQGSSNPLHDITKALRKAGFSAGIAGELANFLKSGAGFNPAVAQALIAAMQPQIQRGEANLEEKFSTMGLREGSPAAIAEGDFLSQVQLDEGQIWAQMYEQSVNNYMNVLLAGKGPAPQNMFQNVNQMLNTLANMAQGAGAVESGMNPPTTVNVGSGN